MEASANLARIQLCQAIVMQLIIDTAVRVFAARGTAVKNIADAAGIAMGSIYQYFKNKEDLFEVL